MIYGLKSFVYCSLFTVHCSLFTAFAADWPFAIEARHKPGTYFWCPGSAWDEKNIDSSFQRLADAGFGTIHLIPIYGAQGYEDRYVPFLSPRWIELQRYAVSKARELGLQFDMTTGSGWNFGGPSVIGANADRTVQYDKAENRISTKPGMKVKRAAPGNEDYMLNPFSPAAMKDYLVQFDALLVSDKSLLPRAQYHDSYEYKADWCADFPEEFKKRRGYDLAEYYPVFFSGADITSGAVRMDEMEEMDIEELQARLKYDYRLTLSELCLETFQVWVDWSRKHGMLTRNEAHGASANLLDLYAQADIPETEMFGSPDYPVPGFRREAPWVRKGDTDPLFSKLASSAAHVAHAPGRQLVASESTTWLRENWHGTLGQMKLSIDQFFLAGVNQMFFHGTCFSPDDAPWPGWLFYASSKVDWRNPIWRDLPLLNAYIARCQSVFQSGEPANDILLYWPVADSWMQPDGMDVKFEVHNDWLPRSRFGELARALWDKGFAFDYVSDAQLLRLKADNSGIHAPGGNYRALVIPQCNYIPSATLNHLAELAQHGAAIIIDRGLPVDAPGLGERELQREQFMLGRAQLLKRGASIALDTLQTLARLGVRRETLADGNLQFIRRRADGETWYFIANHGAADFDGWIAPAVEFEHVTQYDPLTGAAGALKMRKVDKDFLVRLQLPAGGSIILCAGKQVRVAEKVASFKSAGEAIALPGTWSVEFIDGGPELPSSYTLTQPASWTAAPDERAQAFAGTARYSLAFMLPPLTVIPDEWELQLGDLRESARVKINGRDAGAVIALPFALRIGKYLRPATNTLEIEVTSLAANRIRDLDRRNPGWKIMRDINIVSIDYKKFAPADWPLIDCGLLGPVTLRPLKQVTE